MSTNVERELSWDDEINANADEYVLLEPGEYDFRVLGYTRARFPGSAKLPPCNQAKVQIQIGDTFLEHNLFLHTKTEGLICAFFKAIGARQSGERLQMNWDTIAGATGRCVVKVREWMGKDGDIRKSNYISKFLPAEEGQMPPAQAQAQAAPPVTDYIPAPAPPPPPGYTPPVIPPPPGMPAAPAPAMADDEMPF